DEQGAFDGVQNDGGSQEESLQEQAILIEGYAQMPADAGRCQSIESPVHSLFAAGEISSGYSQAATGVFDKRAGHEIGSTGDGLFFFDKLAVAVVDEDKTSGVEAPYGLADVGDVGVGQRASLERVAARFLNIGNSCGRGEGGLENVFDL